MGFRIATSFGVVYSQQQPWVPVTIYCIRQSLVRIENPEYLKPVDDTSVVGS
jgi:hypothetical protein